MSVFWDRVFSLEKKSPEAESSEYDGGVVPLVRHENLRTDSTERVGALSHDAKLVTLISTRLAVYGVLYQING